MEAVPLDALRTPETRYVVIGHAQPQYQPLPALLYPDGKILTEWRLTEEERIRIVGGENIRLWVWTFGQRLQPVRLEVTDERTV